MLLVSERLGGRVLLLDGSGVEDAVEETSDEGRVSKDLLAGGEGVRTDGAGVRVEVRSARVMLPESSKKPKEEDCQRASILIAGVRDVRWWSGKPCLTICCC